MWKLLSIAVTLCFASTAFAQEFQLNKPRAEEGIYCFNQQAAINIADEPKGSSVVLFTHMKSGECIVAQAMVVYSQRVYSNGKVNVYEGKIGGTTIFNPSTYTAEGEKDI